MAAPDRTAFDRYPEERIPVKVKIYSYAILAKNENYANDNIRRSTKYAR